jgi:hypothetical protein
MNVRVIEKGKLTVPEGAPPSPWPLAELLLGEFPSIAEHYAERDVLERLEAPPVIVTEDAAAAFSSCLRVLQEGCETDREMVGSWYREAWAETFQRPPFWAGAPASTGPSPVAEPDPAAHPYPAPVAEPERDPGEDAPAGRAVLDDEPVTDATAVLLDIARKQEAAGEPDATTVMPVTDALTEAVPVVEADGGEQQ